MTLQEQILAGESKILEFKQELPNPKNIAKTVIAFANTSGGKLVIGVNVNRQIIGIDDSDIFALQDKVASIIFDNCAPNILPEIYTVNCDGKLLLVVETFRGNLLPYYLKQAGKNDGTYLRIGATNRKADFANIIELERQRRNLGYDEEINYDIDLAKLDLTPLYKLFEQIDKPLNNHKLLVLRLIKEEHSILYPTNALLILLGKFDHCMVKCARFKGSTMELFLDKKEYSGDIFTVLENVLSFILNHINLHGEIKGLQRTDMYEIPLVALREALINALIHRDYANPGRDIKVGIYDDAVNIVSPGGFPNTITYEDILEGRSEVRNKLIANIFKTLGFVEQWGSGINRIKTICFKHGLKEPWIEEQGDFVDVIFYRRDNVGIPSDTVGYRRIPSDSLEQTQLVIINYINEHGQITSREIKQLLELKESRIREILREMVQNNLLQKKGSGPKTYYVNIKS